MTHKIYDKPKPVDVTLTCGHAHTLDTPHKRGGRIAWCKTCFGGSIVTAMKDDRTRYEVRELPDHIAQAMGKTTT